MFQKVELGSAAIAYVRLRLSTLGSLWLDLCDLDLEAGNVFAFVPPNATGRDLLHFAWHLNHRIDLERSLVDGEYRQREKDFLADYFAGESTRIGVFRGEPIIFQDGRISRSPRTMPPPWETYAVTHRYPSNVSAEVPTVTDVFYLLRAPATADQVSVCYAAIERMPLVAVLTSQPDESVALGQNGEIAGDLIPLLVDRTKHILLSAYGDDATLIWTRT